MEMSNIGFGKMPFQANEDHYGCPLPNSKNKGTLSKSSQWWENQWKQAEYEGKIVRSLVDSKLGPMNKEDFYKEVIDMINEDSNKAIEMP